MTSDVFVRDREKEVERLERELYDKIMSVVAGLLFVDGKAVFGDRNIVSVAAINTAFDDFNVEYQIPYFRKILVYLRGLDTYYIEYFGAKGVASSFEGFGALLATMERYLDSVGVLSPVRQQVIQYLWSSLSQGRGLRSIRDGLRLILGLKERTGALNRYYRAFIFDSIMQFDRIVSNEHAKSAGLRYFVYEGGLIETSREFCIKRDGLVFNAEMADDWKNDPTLPGYPDVADYDPLIHLGRWNCRHYLLWVTDEEAKERNEKEKSN